MALSFFLGATATKQSSGSKGCSGGSGLLRFARNDGASSRPRAADVPGLFKTLGAIFCNFATPKRVHAPPISNFQDAWKEFKIRQHKIKTSRNKIKVRRNVIQIRRNEIQIQNPSISFFEIEPFQGTSSTRASDAPSREPPTISRDRIIREPKIASGTPARAPLFAAGAVDRRPDNALATAPASKRGSNLTNALSEQQSVKAPSRHGTRCGGCADVLRACRCWRSDRRCRSLLRPTCPDRRRP